MILNIQKHIKAREVINDELERGFCHAEVLTLVASAKESENTILSQIPTLSSEASKVTLLEILEIFRYTFQVQNRDDLVEKMKPLLPQGLLSQKSYESDQDALSFIRELKNYKGLIATRLYNATTGHTILLSLDPDSNKYGFYNPAFLCGYYEYDSLNDFANALEEHVSSTRPSSHWQLSLFLDTKNK